MPSSDRTAPKLFLSRRFLPLWLSYVFGVFADNALRQALIIGIGFGAVNAPFFDNDDNAIPIVGALFAISMLVFSSLAGQIADRSETRTMLSRAKTAEVAIILAAAIGFATDNGGLLILSLFAMGAQSAFFAPVRFAAMPKYYETHELIRANGIFNAGLYASILIGMVIGGAMVATKEGRDTLSVLLLGASLTGWAFARLAPYSAADRPDLPINLNIPLEAGKILSFAIKAPGVLPPMLGVAAFFYASTLLTVLAPLFVRDIWRGDEYVVTALMAGFAVGSGAGALCAGLLLRAKEGLGASTIAAAAIGAALLGAYLTGRLAAPSTPELLGPSAFFENPAACIAAIFFVLCAFCGGFFVVPLQAAIQRRAPAETRARIMAAGNMITAIAATAGSFSVLIVTGLGVSANAALIPLAALQFCIAGWMVLRDRKLKEKSVR